MSLTRQSRVAALNSEINRKSSTPKHPQCLPGRRFGRLASGKTPCLKTAANQRGTGIATYVWSTQTTKFLRFISHFQPFFAPDDRKID
jgi:hypothetical protein